MVKKHFKPSKAIQKAKYVDTCLGLLTVINSTRNGKRVEFRKEIVDKLGVSDAITVRYDEEKAIFFKPTDDTDTVLFNVRKSCGKAVIYSYQLVEEIAKFFNLDFTTRVCHTISDGGFDVFEEDGQPVLFIKRAETKDTSNGIINDTSESVDTEREVEVNE